MKSENRSVVVGVKLGGNADKNTKHDEILEGDELFCVLIITVSFGALEGNRGSTISGKELTRK